MASATPWSALRLPQKKADCLLSYAVIDVVTLQWVYLGLLCAFTISLALMLQFTSISALRYWIGANVLSGVAFILFNSRSEIVINDFAFLVPNVLILISAGLKVLALCPGSDRPRYLALMAGWISLFVVFYKVVDDAGLVAVRLATSMIGLAVLTAMIASAVRRNPRWRGLWGRNLLIIAVWIGTMTLLFNAGLALIGRADFAYFSQGAPQSANVGHTLIQLIIVHVAFIGMVLGRQYRVASRAENRRATLIRRRREAEALAHERQSLLQILMHEVRQPLNNALASLQEITRRIEPQQYADSGLAEPLEHLNETIDDVVLALSNAILGASLIERRAEQKLVSVDLPAIANLALGDCSARDQQRVQLTGGDRPLFIQGDPVLLRLAFRNLLDNAIKFSPPDTQIGAALRVDENRLAIVFEVRNLTSTPLNPNASLFRRGARGRTRIEGSGLGLFIVREVAEIHGGTAEASLADDGHVCFGLTIPG
jgi:signal transduction histidine kinase